ncbi:manganese efflux pump [Clostridium sp. CTA-5]
MEFFSPLLLSISSNLDTFRISNFQGIKKIPISKFQIIIISIITTISTFCSMYLGVFIKKFLLNEILVLFGCVVLIFIGIYFFVEYIRMQKKRLGKDTYYYVENTSNFSVILNEGDFSKVANSNNISFKNSLLLALNLSKNNLGFGILGGLIGINIPISVFFNFIVTILSIIVGEYLSKTSFSKFIIKYSYLICGFIVIILGIYQYFV